jgi:hypothetical protein
MIGEFWLSDITFLGVGLVLVGIFWLVRGPLRQQRFIFWLWLLSGPLLGIYLAFPYAYEGEVQYFMGTTLRMRMFYVAEMTELFLLLTGVKFLFTRLPQATLGLMVGGFAGLIALTFTRLPTINVGFDEYIPKLSHSVLTSLPFKAVLIVDSDDVFAFLYEQQIKQVRTDLVVLPARFPLTLAQAEHEVKPRVIHADATEHIAFFVAQLLQEKKRVFLFSPAPSLMTFLGVEANPFYAKPHGYTVEISIDPPNYSETFEYELSALLNRNASANHSAWLNAHKSLLAHIHLSHMYYYGLNGYSQQANSHRDLATSLFSSQKSKDAVIEVFNNSSSRFETQGSFIGYVIPSIEEYLAYGKEALMKKQGEMAEYYLTRALLYDYSNQRAQRAWREYLDSLTTVRFSPPE